MHPLIRRVLLLLLLLLLLLPLQTLRQLRVHFILKRNH
jgi:hypothetical protein